MMGFLLDTNILSELRKANRCDAGVRDWVEGTPAEELYVSVLVLGEIRQGVERIRMRDPAQARALEKWLQRLSPEFADRILPVDERVADQWGRLGLLQPMPTLDAFLAATALVHDLTVVSRDEEGFRRTGVRMINPFSKPKPAGRKAKAESGK
jgi:predicted nucleic acid-binding protein